MTERGRGKVVVKDGYVKVTRWRASVMAGRKPLGFTELVKI